MIEQCINCNTPLDTLSIEEVNHVYGNNYDIIKVKETLLCTKCDEITTRTYTEYDPEALYV